MKKLGLTALAALMIVACQDKNAYTITGTYDAAAEGDSVSLQLMEGRKRVDIQKVPVVNGKFEIKDTTRPYGFVDLGAKVWFQKFLDDGEFEREYLMTEGYIWTGQYPEAQRIIDKGNNQSMELDNNFIDAHWTKDNKGNP